MMLKTSQMSQTGLAGLKPLVQYTSNEDWVVLQVIICKSCCIKGNPAKV